MLHFLLADVPDIGLVAPFHFFLVFAWVVGGNLHHLDAIAGQAWNHVRLPHELRGALHKCVIHPLARPAL